MGFDTLLVERRDHVAYVTLNRPDKLNALSQRMAADLRAAAQDIDADPEIRAVLLTGAGRGFSSGADLSGGDVLPAGGDGGGTAGASIAAILRDYFNPMVTAWSSLRVPLVVAVNGVAAGAGMSLALLGDIVLAARCATFIQLFAPKLGLMPDLGSTFFLPRLIGSARAKGMTLLGEPLSAADAERWGLIWQCVDDSALTERADAIARRLAAGPTQAYSRIKRVIDQPSGPTLQQQLLTEALLQAQLGDTEDFAEGIAAFRGKRAPTFQGR